MLASRHGLAMADRSISQEEAQQLYDAHANRSWRQDSYRGTYCALEVLMCNEFSRRIHRKHRRQGNARTRPDPKVPAWAASAFTDLKLGVAYLAPAAAFVAAFAPFLPVAPKPLVSLAGALMPGAFHDLVESLLVRGEVPSLPDPSSPDHDAAVVLLRRIDVRYQTLRARKHDALRAFFRGTRIEFHAREYGDPTAKTFALLCAARGLEPLTDGMNKARKRWDQRLERWRPEMDAAEPQWGSRAIAWSIPDVAA